ncbi:MAG: alanine dehydrogenase, partial [Euryarchaeota archaeon]|nr:alanine dehydrogenase [Euryarchaeota archaeon]
KAFEAHGKGKTHMPPKSYLFFSNGDLRVMPAYISPEDIAGVKIVSSHPNNPKKGLPTVMVVIILNDPKTGEPMAIMDGKYITDMRTGATGGIAAKYLARKDSRVVGMIGSGAQAKTQLLALAEVITIDKVKVSSRTKSHAIRFTEEMSRTLDLNIVPTDSNEEAVRNSDIVVTTTPSRKPIVMSDWISDGMHINAIGADAPGKRELDADILLRSKIVVDDWKQASHGGEINIPLSKGIISKEDVHGELGEIVAGKKVGRENDEEVTVFDSTGLAIQDVSTAYLVYRKAEVEGRGSKI